MLGRPAKTGILVLALVVLAFEGYLVVRWYERYHNQEAVPGTAVSLPWERTGPEPSQGAEGASDRATGRTVFDHTANDGNSRGDYTYLSDPRIDGDPNAVVLVEPVQTRGAGEYGHNVGVWYDFVDRKKWAVFNQDRAAVPAGTTFRVFRPRASECFVHRAEPENTVRNITYFDHRSTNGRPDITVSATQNWNPGGGVGVYNDHPVDVFYDAGAGRWAARNADGARMPDGAAFNVAVPGEP